MKNLTILLIVLIVNTSAFSQWQQSGGPNGGHAEEIVKVGSALILSVGNGGIYKSTDNGDTWTSSSAGLPINEGVQVLKEYNGLLYVSMSSNGLFLSEDEGENWHPINNGIEGQTFYSFVVEGENIYAGHSNGGVYYSSDNGANWIDNSNGISDIQFQDFAVFDSKVYAGGKFLYETLDNGENWTKVDIIGLGLNGVRSMTATANSIYVSDDGGVFVSSDAATWNKSGLNTSATIVSMGISADSVYLTTSNGRFFYTKDEGLNWTLIQNTLTSNFAKCVLPLDGKILMSTSEGLYETNDDGITWNENNSGISALQIRSLNSNSSFLYAGTDYQGVFRSSDNGNSWENRSIGLDAPNAMHISDIIVIEESLYIGTGGGVYSSSDNGNTWIMKLDPGVNKSIKVLDFNNGVFVAGVNGTGIYISTDTTKTWSLVETAGLNIDTSYESILLIDDMIAVSTAHGEIFISKNLGTSWSSISIPDDFSITYKIKFADNKLYAATTKGLLFSEDLGNSWFYYNNDLLTIYDLIIDVEKIYAATSTGIYISAKSRGDWYDKSGGIGQQYTNTIHVQGDKLIAGTTSSSVWSSSMFELNIPPIVLDFVNELSIVEDIPLEIRIGELIIDDPDNLFPDDFKLTIIVGDNYTVSNNVITPVKDYNGTLILLLSVNDGIDDSPLFEFTVQVAPVNDAPKIIEQKGSLTILQGSELLINASDFVIEDFDNDQPDDFSVVIQAGNDYTISGSTVIPSQDFFGNLIVSIKVNDGELDSQEFLASIDVSEVLNIGGDNKSKQYSIYPNPSSNRLNIYAIKGVDGYEVRIYEANGNLIHQVKYLNNSKHQIDLSSFPDGILIIQVNTKDEVIVEKILKK